MLDFSVVVPVYNRSELVRRALDSVLSQTLPPREVIVVDDGSTDDTAEKLRSEYSASVAVISQKHAGVSYARNKGISACSQEWIAFLDSDDEWCPDKLEKQAEFLVKNVDYLVCHCDEIWIRRKVRVNPKKYHAKSGGWIFPRCLPLCVISPSAVVINRAVFSDVGMFDEQMPVCEDYDLWLRITARYPVGFVNEQLVIKHGGHEDQLSQVYPAMDRFRIVALLNLLDADILCSDYRKLTIQTLLEKLTIYSTGTRKRGRQSEAAHYDGLHRKFQRELESMQ